MAPLKEVVKAPEAAPSTYGLLASADVIASANEAERFQQGVTYEPEGCGGGGVADPCSFGTLVADSSPDNVESEGFVVWGSDTCSTFGFGGRDPEGRARRALAAREGFLIEQELWSGAQTTASGWPNRFLADVANVDIVTESGPVSLTHGLACLEQYLASQYSGRPGMIHCTPQTLTHWIGLNLVVREGNLLKTFLGTTLVPGAGYLGTDPNGLVGDQNIWAYATGMVTVRLGPVTVLASEDMYSVARADNDRTVFATRVAVVDWDGCAHAGARLAMTACDVGGS